MVPDGVGRRIHRFQRAQRLPRLGHVRLGIRVDGLPRATDHFIFDPETQDEQERQRLLAEIKALFGEKPKRLRIVFPTDYPDEAAVSGFRAYTKTRGAVCRGDGLSAVRLVDTATGAMADAETQEVAQRVITCPGGPECAEFANEQCKAIMFLQFMIPELPGLGVWQCNLGSPVAMERILSVLDAVVHALGSIAWVPFHLDLIREEVQVQSLGRKFRVSRPQVTPDASILQLLEARQKGAMAQLLLPPPKEPEVEEAEAEMAEPVAQDDLPPELAPIAIPLAREGEAAERPIRPANPSGPELRPAFEPRDPASIHGAEDFFRACRQDFGLARRVDALRAAGVQTIRDVARPEDASAAYARIAARAIRQEPLI
jgi:hypothetical protein